MNAAPGARPCCWPRSWHGRPRGLGPGHPVLAAAPGLRQEQGALQGLRLALRRERAPAPPLRAGVRGPRRPGRGVPRGGLRPHQRPHAPRAVDQASHRHLQVPLRVPADEHHPGLPAARGGRLRRAPALPHGDPLQRRPRRLPQRPHPRADAHLPVRHREPGTGAAHLQPDRPAAHVDHGGPGRVLHGGDEHHRRDGAARRGAHGPAHPPGGDGLELELPAEPLPGLQAEPQPDGVPGGQLRAREGEPHPARVGPAERHGPAPRAPHRHGHEHPRRALAGAHAQALLAAAAAPRLRLGVRHPGRRRRRRPRAVHGPGVVPGGGHAGRAEHRRRGAARRHHPRQQRPPRAAGHHRHAHPRLRRPDLRRRHRRLGAGRPHHRPGGQARPEGRHRPLGPLRQGAGGRPLLRRHRDPRRPRLGARQPAPGLRRHRLRPERPLPRGRGHRRGSRS